MIKVMMPAKALILINAYATAQVKQIAESIAARLLPGITNNSTSNSSRAEITSAIINSIPIFALRFS
jgi:hypothetical protein